MGHVIEVTLQRRLGKLAGDLRCRKNAPSTVEALSGSGVVPGVEAVEPAALRRALEEAPAES